jgi:hypothetical protein
MHFILHTYLPNAGNIKRNALGCNVNNILKSLLELGEVVPRIVGEDSLKLY